MADDSGQREGGNIAAIATGAAGFGAGRLAFRDMARKANDHENKLKFALDAEAKGTGTALKDHHAALLESVNDRAAFHHEATLSERGPIVGRTGFDAVSKKVGDVTEAGFDKARATVDRATEAVTDVAGNVKAAARDTAQSAFGISRKGHRAAVSGLNAAPGSTASVPTPLLPKELEEAAKAHGNLLYDTKQGLANAAASDNGKVLTEQELESLAHADEKVKVSANALNAKVATHIVESETGKNLIQNAEKDLGKMTKFARFGKTNSALIAGITLGGLGIIGGKMLFSHRVPQTVIDPQTAALVAANTNLPQGPAAAAR